MKTPAMNENPPDILEDMRNIFLKLQDEIGDDDDEATMKFIATAANVLRIHSKAAPEHISVIFDYNMKVQE